MSEKSARAPSIRDSRFPSNRWRWLGLSLLTLASAAFLPLDTSAEENTPAIVRIEEDWVIEINVPDPNNDAPQIISSMSPIPSIKGLHSVFELNHATLPSYAAGGMQLQRWTGTHCMEARNFPGSSILGTPGEVIRFTSSMVLSGSTITFEITNGDSTTWGRFGGQGYLKTSTTTTLNELNAYTPETSVKHSRVGFASHRVNRMVLSEVRYFTNSGLYHRDETTRVVHIHNASE